MKTCTIKQCGSVHLSRGLCSKHYQRYKRYGDPHTKTTKDRRKVVVENGVAKLPIGLNAKHGYALIDPSDRWVDRYNWSITKQGYVMAYVDGTNTLLHRLLTNSPKGKVIDHLNHNILDNRRSNLRVCTQSGNALNGTCHRDAIVQVKGVSWHKRASKYTASICVGGKTYYLGLFKTITEAKTAYSNKHAELVI